MGHHTSYREGDPVWAERVGDKWRVLPIAEVCGHVIAAPAQSVDGPCEWLSWESYLLTIYEENHDPALCGPETCEMARS